jgi:hypothetical protein
MLVEGILKMEIQFRYKKTLNIEKDVKFVKVFQISNDGL